MTIVFAIAAVSILVAAYFIRNFLVYKTKINGLKTNGIATQGLLLEVRNLGLQQSKDTKLSEIAVRFPTPSGKDHVVRHRKELGEGEIIPVGSQVDLVYLESDPSVCNIPQLGLKAENKWATLVTGVMVLVIGLFIAYVVFINLGTV